MLGKLLKRFFLWELSYFLGEQEWTFRVPAGYDSFAAEFAASVKPTSKDRSNPLLSLKTGLLGNCNPDAVMLGSRTAYSPLFEVVGLSVGFRFRGKFHHDETGLYLVGRFIPRLDIRVTTLMFVNLIIFMGFMSLVGGVYEAVRTQDLWLLFTGAIGAACVFLILFFGRRIEPWLFADKSRRETVYSALTILTRDKGQVRSLLPQRFGSSKQN